MMNSSISIEQGNRAADAPASLMAALQRAWAACITWRIEQVAIATLNSMSDLDLQDIGLPRSEIARAVQGGRSASLRSPALGE